MTRYRPNQKKRHKVAAHWRVIRLKTGRRKRIPVKGSERGGK